MFFKSWERLGLREKKKEKRKIKNAKVSLEEFVGGDPYQGMWDISYWVNSPHTNLFYFTNPWGYVMFEIRFLKKSFKFL